MIELRKFMQKSKEIRAQEKFKNLVLDNVCPGFLLKDYLLANKKGYSLRKDKKLITRTWITKDGVILKAKSQGIGHGRNSNLTNRYILKNFALTSLLTPYFKKFNPSFVSHL